MSIAAVSMAHHPDSYRIGDPRCPATCQLCVGRSWFLIAVFLINSSLATEAGHELSQIVHCLRTRAIIRSACSSESDQTVSGWLVRILENFQASVIAKSVKPFTISPSMALRLAYCHDQCGGGVLICQTPISPSHRRAETRSLITLGLSGKGT